MLDHRKLVMMVLAPLAKFMFRKESALRRRSELLEEHAKLADKLFSNK